MKFKFDGALDYQQEAIEAIVGAFDTGANIVQTAEEAILRAPDSVVGNALEVHEGRILKNVQTIQKGNKIDPKSTSLGSLDFSVEMETGTGKTYVYLRTILELNKRYGLKKFIILVPSVAIREGVLKTLEQTHGHFKEIYKTNYDNFVYDSSKLSEVRDFVQSLDVQIMIMTIQSFNTETNIMRQKDRDDTYSEQSYIDLVAKTRPVVIMDEPQNMESELSKAAIGELNPLFRLRYSATHRELHNLMYRLSPIEAYKRGLVKKIQVFGVRENDVGAFVFKVQNIEAKKGAMPRAKVLIEVKNAEGAFADKSLTLKAGDDLFQKTKNDKYAGLLVNDVNAAHNRVELSDGKYYQLDAGVENKEDIFRTQIRETIKAHLDKQESVGERLKVLSLFFIDKVDNYVHGGSLIRRLFTEEFEKLRGNYPQFKNIDAGAVHRGYFASKKVKGTVEFQDTRGDSKLDKEAYDLIMKDKERLLSFVEPVSFIFSHSALKEGWDNPNIFQICTLKETTSPMKKRQEIGRGMRLSVDTAGNRIFEPGVNTLTVVANESYREYAAELQREFQEAGYAGAPETMDARATRVPVRVAKKLLLTDDFKEMWKRISARTRYSIELKTEELVKSAVKQINELDISNLVVLVEKVSVDFDDNGKIKTIFAGQAAGARLASSIQIGDVVGRIALETGITRSTALNILSAVENLDIIFKNPEEYIRSTIVVIRGVLSDLLINEGLKYIPTGDYWEVGLLFQDFDALEQRRIPGGEKSVYSDVLFDGDGEKKFAESLIAVPNVKLFTKLPRGFVVDTPLGGYIPDWAIVWSPNPTKRGGEKLYLVRETKFGYTNLAQELPPDEWKKIICGQKHFEAIQADFKMATKQDLSDLMKKV